MSILIIGEAQREQIKKVMVEAKAHPVTIDIVKAGAVPNTKTVKLKDRKPGFERPPSAHVRFPGGYRAAFSVEEQPAGFCSHLSVSVEGRARKGMMPNPEAVKMICEEFGVPFPADRHWIEEFEPGEFAINLVSLYEPKQEGNA